LILLEPTLASKNPMDQNSDSGCNSIHFEGLYIVEAGEICGAAEQEDKLGSLGDRNPSAEQARTPERDRVHLSTTFGDRPTSPPLRHADPNPIYNFRPRSSDYYTPAYSRLRGHPDRSRSARNRRSSPDYQAYEIQAQGALERRMADLDVREGGDSYRGGGNRGGNRGFNNNNRKRRHDGKLGQFLPRFL
jgi:hypothetical protein